MIPVFAFAEAFTGIGLVVSGLFLLVVATSVYVNQLAGIETIVLLALFGAFSGDQLGHSVGHWVGPSFHRSGVARRYQSSIAKAELLIRNYGSAAIFIGRFVPAIRSLIPAMLGVSGFDRIRYFVLDALACAVWALALGAIVMGLDKSFMA